MATYRTTMKRTLNPTFAVGVLTCAASSPRRLRVFGLTVGSENTPNDWAIDWQVQRSTTAGTAGSAPTIVADDLADTIAATAVVAQAMTADPTLTAGLAIDLPLNLRGTWSWECDPGSKQVLIIPAAAGPAGIAIRTPTINPGSNTPVVSANVRWEE